jgi:Na+-translocating ferredoxin:NAD+ oxidoreductase RNF subunit RnfB
MHEAQIESALCDGCQDCLESCVYDAIMLVRIPPSKRLKAVVDLDRCCGCLACAPPICPQDGIELRRIWNHRHEAVTAGF